MKANNLLLIIGLLLLAQIWSSGCSKGRRIVGNDQVLTETRQLISFDRIENDGSFNVYIEQDSIFTATIEAESNLIPHIRTRINGNTLEIDTRENLENHYPMRVYITAPLVTGAYLNGSGTVEMDSIDTDNIEIVLSGSGAMSGYITANSLLTRISGSGSINLEAYTNLCDARISGSGNMDLIGKNQTGDFLISGSGNIYSTNFEQSLCNAAISGSGNMYLNVIDLLDVNISGSGTVYYIGDPQLNINITGSGSVIRQ